MGFVRIEGAADGGDELCVIVGSNAGIGGDEPSGKWLEVFHVRTKDHRMLGKNRLGRILPAFGEETFSDDHRIGVCGPVAQFAGGIDEKHGGCFIGLLHGVEL